MSLREIAFETEIPLVPLLDVVYVCVWVEIMAFPYAL